MRRPHCAVFLAAGLFALGCSGDGLSEVTGTVRLNGEPVPEGAITFIPVEGNTGPGAGAVIENGKYQIRRDKGVSPGKNRVEIRAFRGSGRKVQDPTAKPGVLTEERVPAFPPEFNDKSTLVRDVKRGSDTIDFDITVPEPGKSGGK
jgi:hypothetical protein